MIICISGLAGSGKTTATGIIKTYLVERNYTVRNYNSDKVAAQIYPEVYANILNSLDSDYSNEELSTIYNCIYLLLAEAFTLNPNLVIITDGMYRKASQRLLLRNIAEKANLKFYLLKMEILESLALQRLKQRQVGGGHGGWVETIHYEEPYDKNLRKIPNNGNLTDLITNVKSISSELFGEEYYFKTL